MDQLIRVAQSPVHAQLIIPGSKSITNRALLLAALANGVSEISDILISDDTLAMVNALQELGVVIQLDKNSCSCIVGGGNGQFPRQTASIWCGDSGIVARFLLAACSASPGVYTFTGSEQLRKRPIVELLRILMHLGAQIIYENGKQLPVTVVGVNALRGGKITVDATETGQFVSALLMIAPFAKTSFMIQAAELVSYPYIEMTCTMMAEFGVLVRRMHQTCFSVLVPQRYQACDYRVEPDFSTASYFFAAAAITGGEVTIQAVSVQNSKQGDVAFLKVLEKMGCTIIANEQGLTVKGAVELRGIHVDMRDFSDIFMTLAVIAPFANTPTTMTNIGHTCYKESNRLAVMYAELEKLSVKVERGADWLKVYPGMPQGATIDSHQDHRIAMAFAVMGLRVPGMIISGAECVSKTCPDFFKLWHGLYRDEYPLQ